MISIRLVKQYIFVLSNYRVLLEHGADANATDCDGSTPLFNAASNCCLEILIELLDKGHANTNHTNKFDLTPLCKAHNYETVLILTKYGAKASRKQLNKYIESHSNSSPEALLNQSMSESNEELLVLDFSMFEDTSGQNEMDLHRFVEEHGKSELLLHPILQIFLDMKWNQIIRYYLVNLLSDTFFVIILILTAYHFLDLVYCVPCSEPDDEWSMNINYNNLQGKIVCFNPDGMFPENKDSACWPDLEKCASFIPIGGTKVNATHMNTWKDPNVRFKCHKNFLR